jgi:hypothetical protein
VEGRQQQLALRHVGAVVEQQHRVRPDDRAQDRVRLAGVQQRRVAREDLLDGGRVAHQHPRALVLDAQRERVAVAVAHPLHERARPRQPAERLDGARHPRAGREHSRTLPPARPGGA